MATLFSMIKVPGLKLSVKPSILLRKAKLFLTTWATGIPSPPSLKPLPMEALLLLTFRVCPFINAIESKMVTLPLGPSSTLLNRSQPSSILWCEMQRINVLPSPIRILAANPSALICDLSILLKLMLSLTIL